MNTPVAHYKNLSLENLVDTVEGIVYVEEWKDITAYEGLYAISSFGRIKSYAKWKGAFFKEETIIKSRVSKKKYIECGITKNNKTSWVRIHRVEAQMFISNPENKPEVNHMDSIRWNNFFKNLEWNTRLENENHARHIGGKDFLGSNHPLSKLSEDQVMEIKSLYATKKYKQSDLASLYGVSQITISRITLNKRLKSI